MKRRNTNGFHIKCNNSFTTSNNSIDNFVQPSHFLHFDNHTLFTYAQTPLCLVHSTTHHQSPVTTIHFTNKTTFYLLKIIHTNLCLIVSKPYSSTTLHHQFQQHRQLFPATTNPCQLQIVNSNPFTFNNLHPTQLA